MDCGKRADETDQTGAAIGLVTRATDCGHAPVRPATYDFHTPTMRILSVTQSYYPFLERGGPAFKVHAMARGLARMGHQVTVLTSDLGLEQHVKGAGAWRQDRWGWRSDADGVETIYLHRRASYRSATWNPGVFSFCRARLAEFEIVHIYGLYDFLGPVVARACRRRGIPYVLEPMGMFRPIVRNIPLKWIHRRLLGEAMVRGASRVIATAPQEKKELVEEGVPGQKIVIRRNGIEPLGELPDQGAFRSQWGISEDSQLVLFLGRLVSKKSPDLLLEAFARWRARQDPRPPAVLVLAGPDEGDGYRGALEVQAERLGLREAVRFTGPLYGAAKWAAFRDADIFVLPSRNENFGNTAAEAVSCGTPVLVTNCCGIAPFVEGRAGVVVAHDCEALAGAFDRLLGDTVFRQQLKRGCQEVARDLDWEQPLAETQALYADLVQEAKKA